MADDIRNVSIGLRSSLSSGCVDFSTNFRLELCYLLDELKDKAKSHQELQQPGPMSMAHLHESLKSMLAYKYTPHAVSLHASSGDFEAKFYNKQGFIQSLRLPRTLCLRLVERLLLGMERMTRDGEKEFAEWMKHIYDSIHASSGNAGGLGYFSIGLTPGVMRLALKPKTANRARQTLQFHAWTAAPAHVTREQRDHIHNLGVPYLE